MPSRGNRARGISDVTGMGIGSKTHQTMQQTAMAAVIEAERFRPRVFREK
jgi:hypothetical protein